MYITSGLFGPPGRNDSTTPSPQHQNTMADAQHANANGLGKRKRHMDAEEGQGRSNHNHASPSRQTSPTTNRGPRRTHGGTHTFPDTSNRVFRTSLAPGARPSKQIKRMSPIIGLRKLPSHLMDFEADLEADLPQPNTSSTLTPTPPRPISESDLRACHICHSAPKRKRDLENYLQCQSCTERACYICARRCSGGCDKQLCSKCCVEVGEEGNTYCLGCYQHNVNSG